MQAETRPKLKRCTSQPPFRCQGTWNTNEKRNGKKRKILHVITLTWYTHTDTVDGSWVLVIEDFLFIVFSFVLQVRGLHYPTQLLYPFYHLNQSTEVLHWSDKKVGKWRRLAQVVIFQIQTQILLHSKVYINLMRVSRIILKLIYVEIWFSFFIHPHLIDLHQLIIGLVLIHHLVIHLLHPNCQNQRCFSLILLLIKSASRGSLGGRSKVNKARGIDPRQHLACIYGFSFLITVFRGHLRFRSLSQMSQKWDFLIHKVKYYLIQTLQLDSILLSLWSPDLHSITVEN